MHSANLAQAAFVCDEFQEAFATHYASSVVSTDHVKLMNDLGLFPRPEHACPVQR